MNNKAPKIPEPEPAAPPIEVRGSERSKADLAERIRANKRYSYDKTIIASPYSVPGLSPTLGK